MCTAPAKMSRTHVDFTGKNGHGINNKSEFNDQNAVIPKEQT
jgi:hypothetical protein